MGSRGTGSGKSGGARGSVTQTPKSYSEAENAFKNADTRKEIRTAVENLVDKLSPGDRFTTAVTQEYQNIRGSGEVLKGSVRTFSITENKNIVNVVSGKEYTTSQFANAVYNGTINISVIEPGTLSSSEVAKKHYGNKGSVK